MSVTQTFQDRVERLACDRRDINVKRMGHDQWEVLRAMAEHRGWPGAWQWSTRSKTIQLADSLVRRGMLTVDRTNNRYPSYTVDPDVQAIWYEADRVRNQRIMDRRAAEDAALAERERQRIARQKAVEDLIGLHKFEFDRLISIHLDHPESRGVGE
jgi:hypothetical protein